MRNTRFVEWRPATAEDILAIFQKSYLYNEALHPDSEPDAEISFNTTVQQWREVNPLIEWHKLGTALNEWLKVDFDEATWESVLFPEKIQTLRGVCELLATRALLPTVKVQPILGRVCVEGSTFMAIRQLLQAEGIPTKKIRPSTRLAPYTRKYLGEFLGALTKLAPGALPVPKVRENLGERISFYLIAGGVLGILVAWIGHFPRWYWVLSLVFGFLGYVISSHYPPKSAAFGGMVTFRDLTYAFVNEIKRETRKS